MRKSRERRESIPGDNELMGRRVRPTPAGDSGAVLILAMMFMALTALIVTGLAVFAGTDINNIGHFKTARSATYAADGAVQTAIYAVRYNYNAQNPGSYCSSSFKPGSANLITIDQTQIYVWCSWAGPSVNQLAVFSAYPAAQCTSASCLAGTAQPSGNPYLTATVGFVDLDSSGNFHCNSATDASSCGFGMNILGWTVLPNST